MASKEGLGFLRGPTAQAFLAGGILVLSCSVPFALRGKNPLTADITEIDHGSADQSIPPTVLVQPGCVLIEPNDTVSDAFEKIGETYYQGNTFRVIYSSEHGSGQRTFLADSPQKIDEQGVVVWPGDQVCE